MKNCTVTKIILVKKSNKDLKDNLQLQRLYSFIRKVNKTNRNTKRIVHHLHSTEASAMTSPLSDVWLLEVEKT